MAYIAANWFAELVRIAFHIQDAASIETKAKLPAIAVKGKQLLPCSQPWRPFAKRQQS